MMARKPGGVDWGSGAGGSRRIPELSSYAVRPWNGSVPATIAYSMTPNAHRSLRTSVGSPRSTSGAIYCSVPTARSPSVSDFCERVTSSSSAADRRFAKPKSSTFAWHICGFQVAVDNAPIMGVGHSVGNLDTVADDGF